MPTPTDEVFASRLQVLGVTVSASNIEFSFGDDGLFAGHTVFVPSFDGVAFDEGQATLFG